MIAFHYPPVVGSSGVQRILHFSNHLLDHDWQPTVLTVRPFAYRKTHPEQLRDVEKGVEVLRTAAFDAARHLAFRGKYPAFLGRPDPWASWLVTALPAGIRFIRRHRPRVIWSTYPFGTAHVVAALLHRLTGVPWVADFRDMMVEDDYPEVPALRRRFLQIEAESIARASRIVVTTPTTLKILKSRYPDAPDSKWALIRNGYDESSFDGVYSARRNRGTDRLRLVHSGILYPSERDPSQFFAALSSLKRRGLVSSDSLQVILRATGHDNHHASLISQNDVDDIVSLAPGIPYSEAIAEMCEADGLLLFQASNCNHQIPAKIYEYFRSGRPILALTDPAGDTAATLAEADAGTVVRLDDKSDIETGLQTFLEGIAAGALTGAAPANVARYSRSSQARQLARLFEEL